MIRMIGFCLGCGRHSHHLNAYEPDKEYCASCEHDRIIERSLQERNRVIENKKQAALQQSLPLRRSLIHSFGIPPFSEDNYDWSPDLCTSLAPSHSHCSPKKRWAPLDFWWCRWLVDAVLCRYSHLLR